MQAGAGVQAWSCIGRAGSGGRRGGGAGACRRGERPPADGAGPCRVSRLAADLYRPCCLPLRLQTSLGPAYIKLGQALSIRPDLLSPAAMNEMQKLCDKVRAWVQVGADGG